MLSYRHAFHAGNFADVLKHSVLVSILNYMHKKDKGFAYIDTHAGAGMYQLQESYAQKTGEYKDGIEKLLNHDNWPELLAPYCELINQLNVNSLTLYPGSPGIAKSLLRRQDSSHLFELHPTDIEHLRAFCQNWRKASIDQQDGYQGLLKRLPPVTRRGVVLMDPPYEIKEDYQKAVTTLIAAHKKFATGTYILWYPVVKRTLVDEMEEKFTASGIRNILKAELCLHADSDEYGMTGTGLFIINPPWLLKDELTQALPYLLKCLAKSKDDGAFYTLKQLVEE
ncbi:23S rRNA (adenine(2030)-N(6))-methyltransferase RlmJ [Thalassotalea ganghwensis]